VGVGYGFNSPTLPSILAELDGIQPIDRSSMNAFENPAFRQAVAATGRRRLIVGGLPVPAAAGTLAAFSANGLFAGLSGLFLATTLHHPSHALSGAALFLLFACGVLSQLAALPASRVLALGTVSMLAKSGPACRLGAPCHTQPGTQPGRERTRHRARVRRPGRTRPGRIRLGTARTPDWRHEADRVACRPG
jgi:hypothetical protein